MRLIRCRYEQSKASLALLIYGTLCRYPETANLFRLFSGAAQADNISRINDRYEQSKASLAQLIYGTLCRFRTHNLQPFFSWRI